MRLVNIMFPYDKKLLKTDYLTGSFNAIVINMRPFNEIVACHKT